MEEAGIEATAETTATGLILTVTNLIGSDATTLQFQLAVVSVVRIVL